jgi:NurA-like 5'-3' nuclease
VKSEEIPVASVTKDPMANKYLKSIYLQFISDVEPRCKSELKDISNSYHLLEERWDRYEKMSELGIIKRVMWDKKLMRTKAVEISIALKEEIPINFLRAGVCGLYMKIEKDRRPYFVEIPCFFMEEIDEIVLDLTTFSYYSPFRGYPSPLYFAHKTATLTQKFSENVFSLAHMSARKILGCDYPVLFEERYREEM